VTIADIDDFWAEDRTHSLYKVYIKEGLAVRMHKLMLNVQHVICTTEELADDISLINSNVHVIPNAVDGNYDGWKVGRVEEKKYIFGYLGGPCHVRDVSLMRGLQAEMTTKLKDYELRLFGYNSTDIYQYYARILSDEKRSANFSLYKGADIWNYPQFYNHLDCSLVPLEANRFNSRKSELKLIEAGHFKKAVIVSNVVPYSKLIRHKKNCLAVNHKQDWFDNAKLLLDNKNLSADLGEQLYEDTRSYSMDRVNKKRFKIYEQLCTTKQLLSTKGMTSSAGAVAIPI
jgi:glycosyltransferase involved in cell wall biosynthesis